MWRILLCGRGAARAPTAESSAADLFAKPRLARFMVWGDPARPLIPVAQRDSCADPRLSGRRKDMHERTNHGTTGAGQYGEPAL